MKVLLYRRLSQLIILILFGCIVSLSVQGQNVAITDDEAYEAHPSAMLDVKSLTKGMLVPRMTTAQREAITSPAQGLLVFDTDELNFYIFGGSDWTNLSSGNPSDLWSLSGTNVYLTDPNNNLGIGSTMPVCKLEVKGDANSGVDEPLFAVVNNSGDTVFAVYPEGVRIYVADDAGKASGSKGGFAVGGFSSAKGVTDEYLRVTPDSVRVYVSDDSGAKASKGGFAVGGFSEAKLLTNEYLRVTPDSVRIYIDEEGGQKSTASKGGFAVGGFSTSKAGERPHYFNISGADTAEIIDPSEARMLWYPVKEAFLTGRVLIEHVDSVGWRSVAMGYEPKAIGDYTQALGYRTHAFGDNSTAIGRYANAYGENSYAFGDSTQALGIGAYAFGSVGRTTDGLSTGIPAQALGNYSLAMGMGAIADTLGAFAIGNKSWASGMFSMALGYESDAYGDYSMALGSDSHASNYACAMGYSTFAEGDYSTASGNECRSAGEASFAAGFFNDAWGDYSIALGNDCQAVGDGSFTFGSQNQAGGMASIAGGIQSVSNGYTSFTYGYQSEVYGDWSTAFGYNMNVTGDFSYGISLGVLDDTDILTDANTMSIMGGEVGIGTLSPDYTLDVNGALNLNKEIDQGSALFVYGDEAIYYNDTIFRWGEGGSTNYFADNVGIFTADPEARLHVVGINATSFITGRLLNGTIVEFRKNGTTEGTISVSGTTVSYNAFTGSHYASIDTEVGKGLLMKLTGENSILNEDTESEIVYGVEISGEPNSQDILGAYLSKEDFKGEDSPHLVMAVGNGQMWVADNGTDLKIGDYLISSPFAGHAMKDNGDYEVANIIARVAEPVIWDEVTGTVDGKKHKLVSVFFENFQIYHNEVMIQKLESENEELKNDINSLKSEIENIKNILEVSTVR